MNSVPNWDTPEEIEVHTESVLFFNAPSCELNNGEWIGHLREKLQQDASEALTVRVLPDGLQRLAGDPKQLYLNSAWVVDYNLLYGNNDEIDAPVDELRSKLSMEFFPDATQVYVYLDDGTPEIEAKEQVYDHYGISKMDVTSNRSVLEGMLRNYFCHLADPGMGHCAKSSIYTWAEEIRRSVS